MGVLRRNQLVAWLSMVCGLTASACSSNPERASAHASLGGAGSSGAGGAAAVQGGSGPGSAGARAEVSPTEPMGGQASAAGRRAPSRRGSGGAGSAAPSAAGGDSTMVMAGGAGAGSAAAGVSGGAAGSGVTAKLVPNQGAWLGEYYGNGSVAETDMRIGRKPNLHLVYFAWNDDWTRSAAKDLEAGQIPLVNWEPAGIDFHDIASGALDDVIKARAAGAKALGKELFLDFAAEMNGDEAWSGNDAALYVMAYRHIHDLFVAAGADNVVWAWCPNVTDTDGSNKSTLSYYPGDAYVDWTGVDGYNWGGGSGFAWQSFQEVFKDIYPLLAKIGKPILIGEMASDETGGDKAAWIDGIVPTLQGEFPLIKGVVWFDVRKERAWQIDSSVATLSAYQRFAADPYMNP